MSHFSVVVCTKDPDSLDEIMAPWDENKQVEPYADEDGSMTTYNPGSKWDYWRIGGRWGGYFLYREGCRDDVMLPERGWDSPKDVPLRGCDGGRKSAIDIDAMRNAKAAERRQKLAEFAELTAGTPEAKPWSEFVRQVDAKLITIDEARQMYHAQPRYVALSQSDFRYWDDAIGEFQRPEAVQVAQEVARALPGYATVTLDGRWMAPGRMGWFGVSSDEENDRIGYWEAANAYIESLPDDVWLIALDCHI